MIIAGALDLWRKDPGGSYSPGKAVAIGLSIFELYQNYISEYSYTSVFNICIMILKYELVLFKEGVVGATLQQLKISIL